MGLGLQGFRGLGFRVLFLGCVSEKLQFVVVRTSVYSSFNCNKTSALCEYNIHATEHVAGDTHGRI